MSRVGERPDPVGEAYMWGSASYRADRDAEMIREYIARGLPPQLPYDADYMCRWREAGGS